MELLEPNTLTEFLSEFDKHHNSGHCYFLGQADASWSIIPGLGRNKNYINSALLKIEEKLYKKFKEKISEKNVLSLIPLPIGCYHESWQWLMAAQHYGLPTRLIDFSHDKYTALEFAVADLNQLNSDGAFIIHCNVNSGDTCAFLKNEFSSIYKTFFFQVPRYVQHSHNECNLSERRKTLQGSKFLYIETTKITECLALDEDHSPWLTKIHIPKKLKPQIIEHLIEKGRFAFDIYAGKNEIDYYASILKNDFMNLNSNNLNNFLS